MKYITFLSSGKCGDTIAALHAVKKHCEKNQAKARIVLDCCGKGLVASLGENEATQVNIQTGGNMNFPMSACQYIKSLIEAQDYVESCEIWDGSTELPHIDINLNEMRKYFLDPEAIKETHTNLQFMYDKLLGVEMKYEPWLSATSTKPPRPICISRSTRYLSAHLWIASRAKLLERESFFIGTDFEHKVFTDAFDIQIPREPTSSALEAANLIMGSEVFISPGNLHYWIALGIGHKNIINELCLDVWTTYYKDTPNISYIQGGRQFK